MMLRLLIAPFLFHVLSASALAQEPGDALAAATLARTVRQPTPAVAAAVAVHEGFAHISRAVLPGVVTVRAFVRVEAASADTAHAAASGDTKGWVAPIEATDYPGFRLHAAASGFVVGEDGEVLSVNSALRKPDGGLPDLVEFETHDHSRILAEIVGAEPTVNLAILQATVFPNGHSRKLTPLRFGESEDLTCGHWVLAYGDPAGPERFFQVANFIAQPSRDCYQDLLSAFYMQVGMVAHPEAYGGPIVDLHGEVVGILAPRQVAFGKFAPSPRLGIEFVLPSKIVAGLHESIRTVRSFQSPWLGMAVMSRAEFAHVRGIEAFQNLAKPRSGILVENVFQPGPAFEVGIQPGDFLVTFGTTPIFTPVDFQRCLYLAGIGAKVRLELWRNGATMVRETMIQLRPQQAMPR